MDKTQNPMREPRLFDSNKMAWDEHHISADILVKVFETYETHPAARIMLVRVAVGGAINPHEHEEEAETAYVLAGQATLTFRNDEALLEGGAGVTVPPGLVHSLRNTGSVPLEMIAIHVLLKQTH